MTRWLLAGALVGLLWAQSALADDQHGSASFFCRAPEDMQGFGELLEVGVTDELMAEAVSQELENGQCLYFPISEGFTYVETVPTGKTLKSHEVWKITLRHGAPAYVLHKLGPEV